jgi:hypothetical protein
MHGSSRLPWGFVALPQFALGDRVLVQSGKKEGTVIGVCYGKVAYDVLCDRVCLQNLPPKLIRIAERGSKGD